MVQGIHPQNMAKNMVQYLHFRILEFPLKCCIWKNMALHETTLNVGTRRYLSWCTVPLANSMVWGGYNYSIHGVFKLRNITTGPHIAEIAFILQICLISGNDAGAGLLAPKYDSTSQKWTYRAFRKWGYPKIDAQYPKIRMLCNQKTRDDVPLF